MPLDSCFIVLYSDRYAFNEKQLSFHFRNSKDSMQVSYKYRNKYLFNFSEQNYFLIEVNSKLILLLCFLQFGRYLVNVFILLITSMNDISRLSNLCGSMNSMYYVQSNRPQQNRFIRVEGTQIMEGYNVSVQKSFQSFEQQIVISSYGAWILLFISVVFSAFVPCWLLADVKSQGFTRNSWRFLTVSVLSLPFLMYQQRTKKDQADNFFNQLTQQKLRPIFVSTINFCIWLLCLMYSCRFTSINHAVCLSCLRFYLIAAIKIKKGQKVHEFQIAGCLLCTLGTLLVLSDSIILPQDLNLASDRYLKIQPWKRLFFGDSLAIFGSFVSVYLDQNYVVPDMPKFTYVFLYNLFLCFNLITFGYFFGGSTFSLDPKFGVFGFFTYQNFVSVMYVSVMLGIYLMIVNILIAQIFNDVIINVGTTFQLIICSIVWHFLNIEHVPSGMTCLGYAFLTPGLIFIIGGQGSLENIDNRMNFELYKPNELSYSVKTMKRPNILKASFSLEKQRKTFDKKPFQMIIEEIQH